MNQNINKELKQLLKTPIVFDFIFNEIKDDEIKEMLGHYTKSKDFIKDDVWRYRLYFTKWNEYVNIHTQYDPVVDTLIYFIDDEKIPDLNSNYIQQV